MTPKSILSEERKMIIRNKFIAILTAITLTLLFISAAAFSDTPAKKVDMTKPHEKISTLKAEFVSAKKPDKIPLPKTPQISKPSQDKAWTIIFDDDFEGSFPGTNWLAYSLSGYANAFWGKSSAAYYQGAASVYCAASGTQAVDPQTDVYPNDMYAWMIAGPFNLSDATDGLYSLRLYMSSEENYDYFVFGVSIDGNYFYGTQYSGVTSAGWEEKSIDLSNVYILGNVLGQTQVYIACWFTSDSFGGDFGAFVDNIALIKNTAGPTPTPAPSPSPSPSPTPSGPTPTPSPTTSPTPTPTPTPFYSADIVVTNPGNANLQIAGITKQNNSSWLSIIPPQTYPVTIAPAGSANFKVYADKTGLPYGTHQDRFLVATNVDGKNPYPDGVYVTLNKIKISAQIVDYLLMRTTTPPDGADANNDSKIDISDIVKILNGK